MKVVSLMQKDEEENNNCSWELSRVIISVFTHFILKKMRLQNPWSPPAERILIDTALC